jgi:hypothetical protein
MNKKLLMILGSGSSVSLGLPSVADLDGELRCWGQEWASAHHCPDYFEALRQSTAKYYNSVTYSSSRPPANFEKTLGEMLALSHWMTPSPDGDTLRQVACNGHAPPDLVFPESEKHGPAITLRVQLGHLLSKLAGHMRSRSLAIDTAGERFRQYAALFDHMRDHFDVGIFNLNYDTAAIAAMQGASTGFGDDGTFEPRAVHSRSRWDFVYHLHGSVHHSLVRPNVKQICWRADLAGEFFDTDEGVGPDMRSEQRLFPVTTLLAGGFKLDQLLVEPFQSLHAALVRGVYDADAILIGGYGFGDAHVNHVLKNRLTTAGDRPPVLIVDKRSRGAVSAANDRWATDLCNALRTNGHFFREVDRNLSSPHTEAAINGSFEVAELHRVALWNGDFAEASSRVDDMVAWLLRESNQALTVGCSTPVSSP